MDKEMTTKIEVIYWFWENRIVAKTVELEIPEEVKTFQDKINWARISFQGTAEEERLMYQISYLGSQHTVCVPADALKFKNEIPFNYLAKKIADTVSPADAMEIIIGMHLIDDYNHFIRYSQDDIKTEIADKFNFISNELAEDIFKHLREERVADNLNETPWWFDIEEEISQYIDENASFSTEKSKDE
jgi:hypothetical protein